MRTALWLALYWMSLTLSQVELLKQPLSVSERTDHAGWESTIPLPIFKVPIGWADNLLGYNTVWSIHLVKNNFRHLGAFLEDKRMATPLLGQQFHGTFHRHFIETAKLPSRVSSVSVKFTAAVCLKRLLPQPNQCRALWPSSFCNMRGKLILHCSKMGTYR